MIRIRIPSTCGFPSEANLSAACTQGYVWHAAKIHIVMMNWKKRLYTSFFLPVLDVLRPVIGPLIDFYV